MKNIRTIALLIAIVMLMSFMFSGCGTSTTTDSSTTQSSTSSTKTRGSVKISVDEWIGWQSLFDANGGLTTAPESINARNGINVEYVVMNDASTSSAALISGELQGAGYTVNRYAFLQAKFDEANVPVVMPYITNYSNGGDGIIAKADIINVSDLVGKKIAVPAFSEAQTLVEWLLNNSSLTESERQQIRSNMVYFETADDTAKAFFSGTVDAAATWEPYLTQAASSTDSRILFDTSMSTNLILDGIVFREDFVKNNEDFIVKLIDGALEASAMYKKEFANIRQLPMFELMSDEEIIDMANGANLATCAQNVTLLSDTAVAMYRDMADVWLTIGETAYPKKAESAFTDKYVKQLVSKYPDAGENGKTFSDEEKTKLIESPAALLDYQADIKFALNSVKIKEESYATLDDFVEVAKILDGVYIQIEGNASQRADGVSDAQINDFSKMRANSVAEYFISKGIDPKRIVVIGRGDSNPLDADNLASEVNRRTEFYFKPKLGY
jgi:NitT/TauT family transport system substrate-binding protein